MGLVIPIGENIYDKTNGQNNLHAKHTKFFLLQVYNKRNTAVI